MSLSGVSTGRVMGRFGVVGKRAPFDVWSLVSEGALLTGTQLLTITCPGLLVGCWRRLL